MFRFLRVTLILWLLSVALIGGAALYGRAHAEPNELQALGFGVCEGRPCFMGITPGVTTIESARGILDKVGATKSQSSYAIDETIYYKGDLRIGYLDSADRIRHITVMNRLGDSLPIRASNIMLHLGIPCRFAMSVSTKELIMFYPHLAVGFDLQDEQMKLDTLAAYITIFRFNLCDVTSVWPGFTSSEQYLKHMK